VTTLDHDVDRLVAAWRRIHEVDPATAAAQLEAMEGMSARMEAVAAFRSRTVEAEEGS